MESNALKAGGPGRAGRIDTAGRTAWSRSRYGLALFHGVSVFAGFLLLRMALYIEFGLGVLVPFADIAKAFGIGMWRDAFVALLYTTVLLGWFCVVPERWFARSWHRVLLCAALLLFWMVQPFLLVAEYFFFEEFLSRFNTVAVDYLIYPHEVFINIWNDYPVAWILGGCAVVAVVWLLAALKSNGDVWRRAYTFRAKLAHVVVALAVLGLMVPTVPLKGVRFSSERLLNEIADNGALSFASAFWTRDLDYAAFYKTLPEEDIYPRVHRMLAAPNTEFLGNVYTTRRRVLGDTNRPRLNIVLIVEESLGSSFWGSLGRSGPTLTPEMDRLAAEEGLLFANLYASGNRTVRGLEGMLCSFPPLPGESIVKRNRSENVESIARILKRDGYRTLFLYGGRGYFDGMRSFAMNNGYDEFIEQRHFKDPIFATIWGVCDEDLFNRGLAECRQLAQAGLPFFATMLTVSNHKPYTYPKGRIAEDPEARKRSHAVKYADYALGDFFRKAKTEPFWTNTMFVVVADHGARVYGRQSIPIRSYEIPLLIAGPAAVTSPARIPHLGCSLDVAPTILGLRGRPYETLFFGRDLLKCPPEDNRVFLNHNRDIGMFARNRLVILGLKRTVEFYQGDPKKAGLQLLPTPADADRELEKDAIAIFQLADKLYMNRQYRID
ncbi:MAG: sulfatase-like hydrolase/transferase [Verrucomicrobia bacterium]|nr:sulfatase-like hydrolase/transferase [Verrucomicrobiota bacterium]